jgi:hypothetical protein
VGVEIPLLKVLLGGTVVNESEVYIHSTAPKDGGSGIDPGR